MNRHEALARALQAIGCGQYAEGRQILRSNFLRTHQRAANDLIDFQERTLIYEANSYRLEPWLEYVAVLLVAVVDGLEKCEGSVVDCCHNIVDCALSVAMVENGGVDVLAEMAIAGREPIDHHFIMTCVDVAKHFLDWKDPSGSRKWLDRLDDSRLDGSVSTIVENIRRQIDGNEDGT